MELNQWYRGNVQSVFPKIKSPVWRPLIFSKAWATFSLRTCFTDASLSIQNQEGCISSAWQFNNTPVTALVITCTEKSYAEGILCIINIFQCDLAAGNKEEKLEPQDHQICITCV